MDVATSTDLSLAVPTIEECDVSTCTGTKRKAEQSCLECVGSYCESHLDMHNILYAKKRDKLVVATGRLQERICPEHDRQLEVFCRTDQQFICHMCITGKHRAHNVISILHEVTKVQAKLGKTQREVSDRIKTREKEVEELKQAVWYFQTSADDTVKKIGRVFTELIHSMDNRQSTVKELILTQQEAASQKANELLKRLQEKNSDLRRRDAKLHFLEGLSQADDELHFLKGILSVPALPNSWSSPVLFVHPYCSFQFASEAVSKLMKELQTICQMHFTTISDRVKEAGILASPVSEVREDCVKYASKITLNLNTAHPTLRLSKENREVTAIPVLEDYTDHPDRFDCRAQILCCEALQGGKQYWEVEYGGNNWVCIAVSYIRITRKGKQGTLFGRNHCSWGLRCYSTSYEFWHDNKKIPVKYNLHCSIIGVYLDHGAGILEFYNVSDNMSLIYKVQTMFTEPLYAGFGLSGKGTHIRLCD